MTFELFNSQGHTQMILNQKLLVTSPDSVFGRPTERSCEERPPVNDVSVDSQTDDLIEEALK